MGGPRGPIRRVRFGELDRTKAGARVVEKRQKRRQKRGKRRGKEERRKER